MNEHKVLIIGGGFAGLRAARKLANQRGIRVTLIDRQNYHLFTPLLYQVATATLEQESIAAPLRAVMRGWRNTRFVLGEVRAIDLEARLVTLGDGEALTYDSLIIAAGTATNFFGDAALEAQALDLKDLDDALLIRGHLLRAFEQASREADAARRAALLTCLVVGAGPTGVEFAGALAEFVRSIAPRDYPELAGQPMRVILADMAERPLPPYPQRLGDYTARRLERLGVELRMGRRVQDVSGARVTLDDGEVIEAETLLWYAGVKASPLAERVKSPRTKGGRFVVEPDLSLPGHPEVFAVGDIAYVEQEGEPLAQVAQVAMQEGGYAARQIRARLAGTTLPPFRYLDPGRMAVIGRGAAVSELFGVRTTGWVAWIQWIFLHLALLVDFRNRLLVLVNWFYDYLFFDRKARLIVAETDSRRLAEPVRD